MISLYNIIYVILQLKDNCVKGDVAIQKCKLAKPKKLNKESCGIENKPGQKPASAGHSNQIQFERGHLARQ